MAWKLADLFVQFSAKGVDAVVSATQKLGLVISGFAVAGLHASTEGEYLAFVMSELSRQIGSLFLPVIEKTIMITERLVDWFANLSGKSQALLGMTGTMIIAIGLISKAFMLLGIKVGLATGGLSLLLGAIAAVIAYSDEIHAMFADLRNQFDWIDPVLQFFIDVDKMLESWVGWLSKIVTMIPLLAMFSKWAMAPEKPLKHEELTRKAGGMESVTSAYQRIQQASLKIDSIAERHLRVAEQQLGVQQETAQLIRGAQPVVGR